jgi:hypothetical protein
VYKETEMTKQDLALKLRKMCDANKDDEPTMIRLFGIKYADEIRNCKASYKDYIELSGIDRGISYQAEIGKGVQLAKYVKLK